MATSHSNLQASPALFIPHSLLILFHYFPYLSLSLSRFTIYLPVLFLSHALFITNEIRSALLILLPSQKTAPLPTDTLTNDKMPSVLRP